MPEQPYCIVRHRLRTALRKAETGHPGNHSRLFSLSIDTASALSAFQLGKRRPTLATFQPPSDELYVSLLLSPEGGFQLLNEGIVISRLG
jgi:hypothetical protein